MRGVLEQLCLPYPDQKALIRKLREGEAFDSAGFLSAASLGPVSVADFAIESLRPVVRALLNYSASDWSTRGIGKGEYGLALLCKDAEKVEQGGDLLIDGLRLEIKGTRAQLYSQRTHATPNGILPAVKVLWGVDENLPAITITSLTEFYIKKARERGWSTEDFRSFLVSTFDLLYLKASKPELTWLGERVKEDWSIDVAAWRRAMSLWEYSYYQAHEGHDAVLFLDPEKGRALLTKSASDVNKHYERLKTDIFYNWKFASGRAITWSLRR